MIVEYSLVQHCQKYRENQRITLTNASEDFKNLVVLYDDIYKLNMNLSEKSFQTENKFYFN